MTPTPEKNSWQEQFDTKGFIDQVVALGVFQEKYSLKRFISEVESQARREERERIKNMFTSKKGLNSEFDSFLDEALNLITLADLKNTPQ